LIRLPVSPSELEREANIAKNRALFEDLGLEQAVKDLGIPSTKSTGKRKATPVRPKTSKRERIEPEAPRRQSRRLLTKLHLDPNETPEERKLRVRFYLVYLHSLLTLVTGRA